MANMSYCRFRNTLNDLADCVHVMEDSPNTYDLLDPGYKAPVLTDDELDELGDYEPMSKEEIRAMRELVTLCEDVVSGFSRDYELEPIESTEE